MQIVIDIPKELKQKIDEGFTNQVIINKLWDATKNGTPLPQRHNRLLILDEGLLEKRMFPMSFSCQKWISEFGISESVVKIIEADKAESEERDGNRKIYN